MHNYMQSGRELSYASTIASPGASQAPACDGEACNAASYVLLAFGSLAALAARYWVQHEAPTVGCLLTAMKVALPVAIAKFSRRRAPQW